MRLTSYHEWLRDGVGLGYDVNEVDADHHRRNTHSAIKCSEQKQYTKKKRLAKDMNEWMDVGCSLHNRKRINYLINYSYGGSRKRNLCARRCHTIRHKTNEDNSVRRQWNLWFTFSQPQWRLAVWKRSQCVRHVEWKWKMDRLQMRSSRRNINTNQRFVSVN